MPSIYHLKSIYRDHLSHVPLLRKYARGLYHGYITLRTRGLGDEFVDHNGLRFQFDPASLIERQMAIAGFWEEDTTRFIADFIRPGMIVAEVGANIGAHTLPIAVQLTNGGRIVAFEPTDWAYDRLLGNIGLNPGITNVVLEKKFVGDSSKPIRTKVTSRWTVDGVGNNTSWSEVTPVLLDDYFENYDRVDIIKIDVDGADHAVIKGATTVIARHRPLIYVELGPGLRDFGSSVENLMSDLTRMGYGLGSFDYASKKFRPINFANATAKLRKQPVINLLCRPMDKAAASDIM